MFYILILFFVGIVVAYFIAKAIVNFIPGKIRPFISILLYALIALLAWKLYDGVMKPIKFNEEKEQRYSQVIKSLKIIREAQAAHKKVTGTFAKDGQALIKFIDTAKFAITEARNEIRIVDAGGGITKEEEYRVIDTVGYKDVRADFAGKSYKTIMKVPGTSSNFKMKLLKIKKAHGHLAPVYKVWVDKSIVLEGMDVDLSRIEETANTNMDVKGSEISIGSLIEVGDAGNWPPVYDSGKLK